MELARAYACMQSLVQNTMRFLKHAKCIQEAAGILQLIIMMHDAVQGHFHSPGKKAYSMLAFQPMRNPF